MLDLGGTKVQSIYFGDLLLDGGSMFGILPKVIWEKWQKADENNRLRFSMQGLLIFDNDRIMLIDSGAGRKYSEKMKKIFGLTYPDKDIEEQLQDLNLSAKDITDVIITHLHFDHGGGLTVYNEQNEVVPRFPNAKYHIQQAHLETSKNPNLHEKASIFEENWMPLVPQLNIVNGNAQLSERVSVRRSDGHTLGMQTVWIRGENESVVYLSDLIPTSAHLPIAYNMAFDLNVDKLMQEREEILTEIIDNKFIAAFEHDPNLLGGYVKWGKKHPEISLVVTF
ncbi:MAG: MBL fold metallo-hydrolase [Planctomycetes bacterium]|nr:MBL fold metallo-hydrolase [Planctomycetota bacterium]